MGKHPPVGGFLRALVFLCLCHACLSQNSKLDMEREDQFSSRINELIVSNSKSEPGCTVYHAKLCFNKMANDTMHAVLNDDDREYRCSEVDRMAVCIENSMSNCSVDKTWPGMSVLHPYVSLLKTIKSTVCSDGFHQPDEEDVKNCDVGIIAKCIMGFVFVASDASAYYTCWQAKQTHTCLSAATHNCKSEQVKNLVSMVSSMLSQTAKEVCMEPGCHVAIATECLYMAKSILLSPVGSVQKSPVLCGAMMNMLSCVANNTMNCDDEVYAMLGNHMLRLHEATTQVCEDNTVSLSMTDPYVGHIASFYAVTQSPFASKETVCPFYHSAVYKILEMIQKNEGNPVDLWYTMSMAAHIAKGICEDDKMCGSMEDKTVMECNLQRAEDCIQYTDVMSLISNVDVLGWDLICSETLKMAECVHHSLSACNMSMPIELNRTVHHILGMVASNCPVEPIMAKAHCLQPKCDVQGALIECFMMPNETIIAGGQACMMVNETMHCVKEKTAGCALSPSLLPLTYSIKQYLDAMRPYCFTPALNLEGDDVMTRVKRCTFNFMDGFQQVMAKATNFSSAMCHLYLSMDKECSKMDDLPMVLIPGMKIQEMIWAGMIDHHCAEMKGQTDKLMWSATQESKTCQVYMAASYVSNYWLRLMQVTFTPVDEMSILCSSKEWFAKAVKNLLVGCSHERESVFMDAWMMVDMIHKHACPVEISVMKSQMSEDGKCHIEAATRCVEELEETLIMSSAYYKDDTCMTIHNSMKCLQSTLSTCAHDTPDVLRIKERFPAIRTMIGNECWEYFSGSEFCNASDNIFAMMMNKMECDKITAAMCVTYFEKAKPMLEHNSKELCRAVMGTKMCVYAKTNNCSDHNNISNGRNLTVVIDYLEGFCPEVMTVKDSVDEKDMNRNNKTIMEKQCHLLQVVAPCTMSVEACFNQSMNPTNICRNSAAIKACLSLATVGCDDLSFTAFYDYLAKTWAQLKCDILPTPPVNCHRSNITFPLECLANSTDILNFLKNNKSHPNDICKEMPLKAKCLEEKSMNLPFAMKIIAHKLSSAFRQQAFFSCNTTEKILDKMDMLNDTAKGNCSIETVALCIYGHGDGSMFGLATALMDRERKCSQRIETLKCIQGLGSGCSEMVKNKILALLDWNNGIMTSIGICSEEMPRHCDAYGALNCISQLGVGQLTISGTEMEGVICGAIAPVEKCVVDKTSTCPTPVRMSIEQSLVQVTSMARSVCTNMETNKMVDTKKGDCDMDALTYCASQVLNRTGMLLLGEVKKEQICQELEWFGKCADMHSVNCPGESGQSIEAHKPLYKLLIEGACSKELHAETKEAGYCMQMAGACLVQYLHMSMVSYTGMCTQAVPTLACLKTAIEICPSPHKLVVSMATKHLATMSIEMCGSKGCNPQMAYRCLTDADKYIKAAGSKLLDYSMNCGALMPSLICAMNHTVHCDMKEDPFLDKSIKGLKLLLEELCPKMKHNEALGAGKNMTGAEALIPLSILISNTHVTKEMICPQMKLALWRYAEASMDMSLGEKTEAMMNSYIVERIVGTFCHDEEVLKNPERTQSCNVSMVLECAHTANIAYKISTASLFGIEPVRQAASQVLCCIHEMASSCRSYTEIYATTQLAEDIINMVKEHYSVEEIVSDVKARCSLPPEPCNTHEALAECYVPLTTRDDVNELCRNLTEIEKCFQRNIKGCMSIQMVPLINVIKSYRSMCGVDADITTMLPHDQVSGVAGCFMKFSDDLSKSLRTTKAPFRALCKAALTEHECIYKSGNNTPPVYSYLSMSQMNIVEDFSEKFCNQSEDTTSKLLGEPYACMAEVAETCFASYFSRISTLQFLPLKDREDTCRELLHVETCLINALKSCSPERQKMYMSATEMIYFVHDHVCPTVPRQPLLLQLDYVCQMDTAQMCIEAFGKHLASASADSSDEACRQFQHMMKCVAYSTRNCTRTTESFNSLVTVLETAQSIMGNKCPLLSTLVCNAEKWQSIVYTATCDQIAAAYCMMEFMEKLPESKNNDTAMCSMYKKSMECTIQHTLLCDHDRGTDIDQSVHVLMATYGSHCSQVFGESAEKKCMMKESCSLWIEKCFPEDSEEICSNVAEIQQCLIKQDEDCSSSYKQERHSLIKNFLVTKNVSCDILLVMSTKPQDPVTFMGGCYMVMKNLTNQFIAAENPTDIDVCYGLGIFRKCVEDETKGFNPLWKGMWDGTIEHMEYATDVKCKYIEYLMKKEMEMEKNGTLTDNKDSLLDSLMNSRMKTNSTQMDRMNYTEHNDCDPHSALRCLFEYISMTTHSSFIPLVDRSGTCWYKKEISLPCVMSKTASCSARIRSKFIRLYEVTKRMEISIGQCPGIEKEMKEKDLKEMDVHMCQPEEAAKCMGMLAGTIIGNAGKISHTLICSSILPTYTCIMKTTWGCEKHVLEHVESVWSDLYVTAMATCTSPSNPEPNVADCEEMSMEVKWPCDLPEAVSCLTDWHTRLMNTDEDICSDIPMLRSCIQKHLFSCEQTHREAFDGMLSGIHRRIAERCPMSECDICGAATCMMGLNTTNNDMTCFDIWKTQQCVKDHIKSCGDEEKQHVLSKMAVKLENVSHVCHDKESLDMCAHEFIEIVKEQLGIKLDFVDEATDDDSSKEAGNVLSPEESKYAMNLTIEEIFKHLMSNQSSCPASIMADDESSVCKRAAVTVRCVEMLVNGLPSNVRDLALGTVEILKIALEHKCEEKELTCFKCRGASSDEECNRLPQQQCDKDTHMCYAQVDNGRISKGCALRIPFIPHNQCVNNGTKCAYLCDLPDCNVRAEEGIMDPPTCNRKMAVTCGIKMVHNMVHSVKPDCSILLEGLMCLHKHSQDCMSHVDGEISKQAASLFFNQMMLKCQTETHDCSCGRCSVVTLGSVLMNPLNSISDVCRIAQHTQKKVVEAVIMDQCSMADLKELTMSVGVAKSLLGDACESDYVKMLPVHYNETCDFEKAEMCLQSVNISWLIEQDDKFGKHTICSTVYKIIGCVRHSTESCDYMSAVKRLNSTVHHTLSMVSKICNLTLAAKLLSPEVRTEENNTALVENLAEAVGDSLDVLLMKMGVINEVMRTGVRSFQSICKPSLALHHCFNDLMLTPFTSSNFCSVANSAWNCLKLLTKECLPVQSIPVYHFFYSFVSKDAKSCGYSPQPTEQQLEQWSSIPTYNLSTCIYDFIFKVQSTYINPTSNMSMATCKSAVDLDNCVYQHSENSPIGKIASMEIARMTAELKRVSCMAITANMSKGNCSKEDILCQIVVNMTYKVESFVQSAQKEPTTCMTELASFCISNYVSRMVVSPFAPITDHQHTCRDLKETKRCLDITTSACSEPRRHMFDMAYGWIHNMTFPVCSTAMDMSELSCHKARMCVDMFGLYSMKMKMSSEEELCTGLEKTMDCVEQHSYNCTADEMTYLRKSLYVIGNMTSDACPTFSQAVCSLTGLEPRDVSKTCDENKLRQCVLTYYETTYGKNLTNIQYCSHLMTGTKCFFENSKYCPVHTVGEFSEVLLPGLRSHDVNCTDVNAYVVQQMPRCAVKHCKMSQVMHGMESLKENVTKMRDSGKTVIEICSYVETVIRAHMYMIDGCNSLQSYLLNYTKNMMLGDYLSKCPGNINSNIAVPINDAVAPLTKCFSDLDTNMEHVIKSPRYGFVDICLTANKFHVCLDKVIQIDNEPALNYAELYINGTNDNHIKFLRQNCQSDKINMSMLVPLSLPAESANCKMDTVVNCVKFFAITTKALKFLEDEDMICRGAEMVEKCMKESLVGCSTTLKWQVKTVYELNRMMIGEICGPTTTVKSPEEKTRDMYNEIIWYMTMANNWNKNMSEEDMIDIADNTTMEEARRDENDIKMYQMVNRMNDMDSERCNLYLASQCLLSLITDFDMMAEKVCHNSDYLSDCVRPHIESCDDRTKFMVEDSVSGSVTTVLQKACAAYEILDEYLDGDKIRNNMDQTDIEKIRNAMDQKESGMEIEEMREKHKVDIENIFRKINKIHVLVNFVRSSENPLEINKSELGEMIEMMQKLKPMSSDMTDCIEIDAFEGQGYCYPSAALECARAVEVELMSPWATKSTICIKYAMAVRCAMLTSQDCDHMTTEYLHLRFHEVMGHVGNMCPTVIRESCEVESECKVHEVQSCLMPLHSKIMATLELPMSSSEQLCGYIDLTRECVIEKITDCPEQVTYQLHTYIKPVMDILRSMCQTLPGKACFTSLLWNMGSVLTLDMNIRKTGSLKELLELSKKHNKTVDLSKYMEQGNLVDVGDEYLQAAKLIHVMMETDQKMECKISEIIDKGNETEDNDEVQMDGSMMAYLLNIVKYVLMNEGLLEKDEQFVKKSRISMLNFKKDQIIQDLKDLTDHVMTEIHEHFGEKNLMKMNITKLMVMNRVLKVIVGMGNGHEIITAAYRSMANIIIGHMMDQIKEMALNNGETIEQEDPWDYLNHGLIEGMKEKMKDMVTKYVIGLVEVHMKPDNMDGLEGQMMLMKSKKLQTCSSMIDVVQCSMQQMALLPQNKRQLMNITLQALTAVATAICHPAQQCYACNGVKDNQECNKQTLQTCDIAQSCYTWNRDGLIFKGCWYPIGNEFGDVKFCEGSMCNKNQYSVEKDDHDTCKPMAALMCLAELVPVISMDGQLDQRLIYKNLDCIEQHVSSCNLPHTRMMADLVPWIKHGLYESTCSGEESEYQCGFRSIIGLAMTVMNPTSSRISVCSQLNDTYRLLEWAEHHNKCSDYEKITAYKGLKTIMHTLGPDYCPGVEPKPEVFCKNDTMGTICDKKVAAQCFIKHNVMAKITGIMSNEDNENFCLGLTELLRCIKNNTSGCKMAEDLTEVQNMFKDKIGQAVSHCPVIEMTSDLCYPEFNKKDIICQPALVPTSCFDIAKDGCSILDNESKMEAALQCIHNYTSGCSSMQKLSVFNIIDIHMSDYLISCGNNSVLDKLMNKKAPRIDHTIARVVAFVGARSMVMTFDDLEGQAPVMDLLHKLIKVRMNMTGMMQTPMMNMSSAVSMKAMEFFDAMEKREALVQDDTVDITSCAVQFDTHILVALSVPALFDQIYCEGLTAFERCLSQIDSNIVINVLAMSIKDKFAGYREMSCHNYMDRLVDVGKVIVNFTGYNGNMSEMKMLEMSEDKWNQLLNRLQKEDNECDTFGIASILSHLISHVVTGPFKNQDTFAMMCLALDHVDSMIKPMTDKCSKDNRAFYQGVVTAVRAETASVCQNPVMNLTVPATCLKEQAKYCLSTVMPFLSSKGTPDFQLCWHVSMASQCVYHSMEHCSAAAWVNVSSLMTYMQTVIGDRCPLVTAFSKCYTAPKQATCSFKGVKDCVAKVTTCSGIPDLVQCISSNSVGCSNYESHKIIGYMDIIWENLLHKCPEKDVVSQLYSKGTCQPPLTCSLAEAYNCSRLYANKDCSNLAMVQSCFEQKTRGCNSIQFSLAKTTFEFYHRMNYPLCTASTPSIPFSVGDLTEFNQLYHCVNMYANAVPAAMNTSEPMKNGCKAYSEFITCIRMGMTEEEAHMAKIFIGNSFNITQEIMRRFCDMAVKEDTQMFDAADKCDRKMADQCLSIAGIHTMFSSVMAQKDKQAFCSQSMYFMVDCAALAKNCMNTTSNSIRGALAIIDTVKWLSGVCAEELWVCSPSDAVYCGSDMVDKMAELAEKMNMTNNEDMKKMAVDKNMTIEEVHRQWYQQETCSIFEETMSCVERLTFACSNEVNANVKQSVMTSICLNYDLVKTCPSVMETKTAELPKCMDNLDEDDTKQKTEINAVGKPVIDNMKESECSLVEVNMCVAEFYQELYGPFLDCNRFHRNYVKAMQCIHIYSRSCSTENPSVGLLIGAIANLTVSSAFSKCPNVVNKPCIEPDSCDIEQVYECMEQFTEHFLNDEIYGPELCLSGEIAKYCNMQHTKECSFFVKGYLSNLIDIFIESKQISCDPSPDTCLYKYYATTVGILHGDLVVASILKRQQEMTFDIADLMMDQTKMDYMMANATRIMMSVDDRIKQAISNFSDLSNFLDHKTITLLQDHIQLMSTLSESEDHMATYTEVKMLQCVALHESWSCLLDKGDEAGLSTQAVNVLNATLGKMFEITSSMCSRATVMSLAEESSSCHILPAAMTFLNHVIQLTTSVYGEEWFCNEADLAKAIDGVNDYTAACSSGIRDMFDELNSLVKVARDNLCRYKPACNKTLAMDCINQFKKQMNCSSYETAHSCVEMHVMGCDQSTADATRKELQTLYSQISCQKLPKIKTPGSPLRLVEGSVPVKVELAIEEDPSLWCLAGEICRIDFDLDIDNGSVKCKNSTTNIPQIVIVEETGVCQRSITKDNWQKPVSYSLLARVDGQYDGTHNIGVNVTAHMYVNGVKKLSRVVSHLEAVVVNTDQPGLCTSVGGNRMSTFDGLFAEIGYQGEFVAYKHKKYPQEVHTLYQKCSSTKKNLCVCAVMIKVADDSITIDKCRRSGASDVVIPTVTFYKVGELTTGVKIFTSNGGKELKVLLPTGTVVGVDVSNMRFWVIPSALDWLQSEGLCGVFDANKYNDAKTKDGSILNLVNNMAPSSLASSWRVQAFESLFNGGYSGAPAVWDRYCTCSSQASTDTCAEMMIASYCDLVSGTDITSTLLNLAATPANQGRRRKRAVSDPLTGLDVDYTYIAPEATWPSNWNETLARTYCEKQLLKSDLGQKCLTATGSNFESEVLACIYSIRDTADTQASTSTAMESIKIKCVAEIDRNLANLVGDSALIKSILDQTCPNDCTSPSNGNCKSGTCQCYSGYTSADCSIPEGTEPTVTSLRDGNLCELSNTNGCTDVIVIGQNFLNRNTLSCHYEATGQTAVKQAAQYITSTMVRCSGIPPTTSRRTWTVTVTNSGIRQTATGTLGLTVYHPACFVCADYLHCVPPTPAAGCLISDVCYHSNAENPTDTCQRCIPPISSTAWTHIIGGSCIGYLSTQKPPSTSSLGGITQSPSGNTGTSNTSSSDKQDYVAIIVLGCLTGAFALISIFLLCKICTSKKKEIKSASNYSPSASESASNKEYDTAHAFDNLGYSSRPYQKQFPVEDLSTTVTFNDDEMSRL